MKLQWGGRGVWGKVGCFLFTPVQQLLPALPWRIGWTCQWDHLRKRSPLHVLLFCDSLTFRAVKLADLLLHASLSPSSVSYKTTVSALPTYDRGTATCCLMPSRQEKSKTDFSVCKSRYCAALPETYRKQAGRKGWGLSGLWRFTFSSHVSFFHKAAKSRSPYSVRKVLWHLYLKPNNVSIYSLQQRSQN